MTELIGEAAMRLPDELREAWPAVPWQQIISMRNWLIHGYDGIDPDILLDVMYFTLPHEWIWSIRCSPAAVKSMQEGGGVPPPIISPLATAGRKWARIFATGLSHRESAVLRPAGHPPRKRRAVWRAFLEMNQQISI